MGIIEELIRERYGLPEIVPTSKGVTLRWTSEIENRRCTLYKGSLWSDEMRRRFGALEAIYGDLVGGSLLAGAVKISLIQGDKVFGLYMIDELWEQPEVCKANEIDPAVCYFMDSANVWYYGVKAGELFVFDTATDELDSLGPFESAFHSLLAQWEAA